MSDLNEQILLFQIRTLRSQDAFTRLFEKYKKELYRYIRAKLPTAEDTDDLLSTVFLRAWVYITTSHGKEHHFRGLIYHMARNAIADYYRSRKDAFSVEAMGEAGIDLVDARQSEAKVQASVDASLIKRHLAKLKVEYREVLAMRYFDGMDVSDIAKRLEKTENNVRVLLHRALREFRKYL